MNWGISFCAVTLPFLCGCMGGSRRETENKQELHDFVAETIKTTTQTIYGDAKWVVFGMLGLFALGALAWIAERVIALRYRRGASNVLSKIVGDKTGR